MSNETVTVKVGQIWADNDPRSDGREVIVDEIRDGYALCHTGTLGKKTKIKLGRFKPTRSGYKLVRDVEE